MHVVSVVKCGFQMANSTEADHNNAFTFKKVGIIFVRTNSVSIIKPVIAQTHNMQYSHVFLLHWEGLGISSVLNVFT